MKFLVDMNLSPLAALHLNNQGHDAVHARNLGLKKAKDKELLKVAVSEKRIVVTQDLDFGELILFAEKPTPGVIIIRITGATLDRVNLCLKKTLSTVTEEEIRGTVVIVEEDRIRIHEKD
ncbi:MAG TPA: hypothetical protein ENN38_05610 [Actinobacteria bacterium]|nr:hypothetical protein [Actinomycetota bacterium]